MSSVNDDFLDLSARATEQLQQRVFVGISSISFEDACQNAWVVAQGQGIPSGTSFNVINHMGLGQNPFTDFRVTIVVTGAPGA
jgi:hypothetical protein